MSKEVTVTFPVSTLPKEEDFYQFQYLKGDNQVAGASVPFQLRSPGSRKRQEAEAEPAATAVASLGKTFTKLLRSVCDPSPSMPFLFDPVAHTLPSCLSTML